MGNKVMSDSYSEALSYVITSQAQALEDKNKSGAFIALFLQSVNNKYGEAGLKLVIEAIKHELPPDALQKLGNKQEFNMSMPNPPRKQSSLIQRIRNNMKRLP
ncbi:hypothetical protein [Candidatus Magnetominusculus xianensis]|uniref:Uncharacterized protein n=1 Tax=Candidatus Magnetominusculus xianensis TaxID=1748249 RepID=A0ABR5SBC4_9BACT|nr:hypothetical protein [Candidatus Magnetominusculus xianensis]KWT76843.1 hypothetical protein ASN18_3109 [Candidatus Magnetominusculus xianensis]MBF0402651.1 hypothetical protein [Nitrospirota bacterium]